ncbi:MAG: hypothetical protein PHY47_01090 [Lachnospiraceae bacterium]|nr:hypothetical protein [Lachnospiraceae bacterium]
MNKQKFVSLLEDLAFIVQSMQQLLMAPEKIQILNIQRDDFSYVHYWHPSNTEPMIILNAKEAMSDSYFQKYLCQALNKLTFTAGKTGVEWVGDFPWDKLPENFMKLDKVLPIEKRKITAEELDHIKETENAIHYMSSELQIQETH